MTIWCDAETAVQVVESGNKIFLQGMSLTPTPLIEALVARGEELRNVELYTALTFGPAPYTDPRWVGHFHVNACFVATSERPAVNAGRASYIPIFLSSIPKLFMPGGPASLDVAFIHVSPPDKHGFCSMGPSVDFSRAAIDNARHVVALVNPHVPRVYGHGFVHESRLDYAVKWDRPIYAVPGEAPDDTQRVIGQQVAELIEDGSTLQLGIGAIPDAALQLLTDRRDLGIHTEMFSDGVIDLVERGVITGTRKSIDHGKIVASFVVGSRRLLDFLDDNPIVELRSISYTNDLDNISQFDRMVAINSALEVDLTGQVCSESIGTRQYSGVGGQIDFLQGTADAPHGVPVLTLAATAPAREASPGNMPYQLPSIDGQVSRIVPTLTPGSAVTTTRAHVHQVVAGVDMLTRVLAIEWGRDGIRVNAVVPGPIEGTEGMVRLAPTQKAREIVTGTVPAARWGTPRDVADVCLFLASPLADYVTGVVLPADGGWSLGGASTAMAAIAALRVKSEG